MSSFTTEVMQTSSDTNIQTLNDNNIKKESIKNIYIKFEDEEFNKKIGKITCGLDKVIPWDDFGIVLSGGILRDILVNNYSDDFMDIDLFLFGTVESKKNTLNKILINLDMNQYNYLLGYTGSVIYIFIQGIPRILQLIMTNKTNSDDIINSFDLSHLQFYYDGINIFGTELAISQLKTNESILTGSHCVQYRLLKYIEKGIDLNELFYSNNYFILNFDVINKKLLQIKQIKMYKSTYNLSVYPDMTPINFDKFLKTKLYLKTYFEHLTINYTKFENINLDANINMIGNFIDYYRDINPKINDIFKGNEFEWTYTNDKKIELNKDTYDKNTYYQNNRLNDMKCIFIKNNTMNGFYLPCEYLNSEDIYFMDQENNTKTGKRIYFKLTNNEIIKKIITLVNFDYIKSNQKKTKYHYSQDEKIRIQLLQKFNDDDKIIMPFENTKEYPNINKYAKTNNFLDSDGIIIRSNIYDLNYFENNNKANILNNLVHGQKINCIFSFFTYVSFFGEEQLNINNIEINLQILTISG